MPEVAPPRGPVPLDRPAWRVRSSHLRRRGQEAVEVVGIGASPCAQFNSDVAAEPAKELVYFAWAQGYLSGVLRSAPPGVDERLDLLSPAAPLRRQIDFVRAACAKDPRADYVDAVDALYRGVRELPLR